MKNFFQNLSYPKLLTIAAIFSLLFSLSALLSNDPINPDGMVYIKTAQAYLQHGVKAAFVAYNWPFFSILAAWVAKVISIKLVYAFHLLNIIFQVLLVLGFIRLLKILGAQQRILLWSALVILIFPTLNGMRDYVTRDFAYWAFALYAFSFLINYLKQPNYKYALFWGLFMIIASLFRVEGFVFLATAPMVLLIQPGVFWRQRIKCYLKVNLCLWLGLVGMITFHIIHHSPEQGNSRLYELVSQLTQTLPATWHKMQTDIQTIKATVLNYLSKDSAPTLFYGGLLAVLIMGIITAFKPLYLFLACFGQQQKLIKNTDGQVTLLNWTIFVNLIMLALFVAEQYFIVARYPIFMVLLWMSWVPFALENIYQAWQQQHKMARIFWPIILLWLLGMAISGLCHFGVSKAYISNGGRWLYQHMQPNQTLFSTSNQLSFYASDEYADEMRQANITDGELRDISKAEDYDWVALRINKDDLLSDNVKNFLSSHQPMKVFINRRGDQVQIYHLAK
ncbi:MAG: hypothetical protein K0S08_1476 [Gammaproteobacteria bacterium]|jgi:hypothetical protein|nr:hypothetical protein [Gammaproteobacteria bacterium]